MYICYHMIIYMWPPLLSRGENLNSRYILELI